jgi:hypothetical protein
LVRRLHDADCGSKVFDSRSLAGRLLQLTGRANSHALVFLDHQYDWGRWNSENEQIANGITNYLKSLVSPSVLKNIVIAGHSRGGCLALTVSRKLRADPAFRSMRLIVLPLDAVCNPDKADEENWASKTNTDDNPVAQTPGAELARMAAAGNVVPLKGDFDSDGRDDIALLRQTAGWNTVPVAFATPGGWRVTNSGVGDFAGWAATPGVKPLVGDLNADGREDIALLMIRATAPADYIPRPRPRFDDSSWVQMSRDHALPEQWETLSYADFLEQRRVLMAKVVRRGFEALACGEPEGVDLSGGSAEEQAAWKMIEAIELDLRTLVRRKYLEKWGDAAGLKMQQVLGDEAWQTIQRNRASYVAKYGDGSKHDPVLDFAYLGQLSSWRTKHGNSFVPASAISASLKICAWR